MHKFNTFLLAAASLCCASISKAQSGNADSLKQKQHLLQPVEVRALRASTDAPFAKTEITRTDIEKADLGQDIPYLLQYTPSAVVTSDAGTGIGYTGLRIRGTDGIRINVTLNGIPVNDAESQGAFFVDFPDIAASLSSIQLQRGVGTSTNGAGAFGATISLSNLYQLQQPGVESSNSAGSFNTWRNTLHAGTGLMKNGLQFDVRLSKISSDGYIDRSASDLKSAQIIAGWQMCKNTSLRFMLMTGKEKTGQAWNGVPGDSLSTNRTFNELGLKSDGTYYNNQTDNYQQDYYQLFFDHKFSKSLSAHIAGFYTRGKGYYEEYKMAEAYVAYGLPDFVIGADTITTTDLIRQLWLDNKFYGTVFSLLYEKKKTQISFGGGWNQYSGLNYGDVKWAAYNIPDNYRWYQLDAQKNDLNLYIKAQHTIAKKLVLFGDLQYRNVAYFINGFRRNLALHPDVNYDFINPKAGITYLLKNNNQQKQKVYASFAVANKEPNRDDFEAASFSLPKPERLYDVEAGYELNKKAWNAGANYYYMSYEDQLVFTGRINDVGAYTRTNVPKSYRTGIELQAGVIPFYWLKVNANATFSKNIIKQYTEYIDNYDDPAGNQLAIVHNNTRIALSPATIAAGGLTLAPFRHMKHGQVLEMDIMGKHVGKQYLDNSSDAGWQLFNNSGYSTISDYTLCDLRFRYSIQVKPFRELGLSLALNNIFDRKYESNGYVYAYQSLGQKVLDNRYFPQAGFNWLLGVNMKW
jgi:iron complex outermembrane receptor protein